LPELIHFNDFIAEKRKAAAYMSMRVKRSDAVAAYE